MEWGEGGAYLDMLAVSRLCGRVKLSNCGFDGGVVVVSRKKLRAGGMVLLYSFPSLG
jgi:hypothetical protein